MNATPSWPCGSRNSSMFDYKSHCEWKFELDCQFLWWVLSYCYCFMNATKSWPCEEKSSHLLEGKGLFKECVLPELENYIYMIITDILYKMIQNVLTPSPLKKFIDCWLHHSERIKWIDRQIIFSHKHCVHFIISFESWTLKVSHERSTRSLIAKG